MHCNIRTSTGKPNCLPSANPFTMLGQSLISSSSRQPQEAALCLCRSFYWIKIPDAPGSRFIFSPDGKKPISDSFRRNGWTKFQKEAGISCTLHQLRHAYASLLCESGVDEKTAQKLMGHSDITTTLRIYTHLRDQHLKISQDIFRSFLDSK